MNIFRRMVILCMAALLCLFCAGCIQTGETVQESGFMSGESSGASSAQSVPNRITGPASQGTSVTSAALPEQRNSASSYAAGNVDRFTDIDRQGWYGGGVAYCIEQDIMNGVSETAFAPSQTMSRAMYATVLWRIGGSAPMPAATGFSDVPEGQWYSEAIRWAAFAGVVNGYSDTVFGRNDPVTREQIVTMLYRFELYRGGAEVTDYMASFADRDEIAPWARDAVRWASEKQIIRGRPENIFAPRGSASRAETAVMLYRYLTGETGGPGPTASPVPTATPQPNPPEDHMKINISVGEKNFTATLNDNETAAAFRERLPLTVSMNDMNQNEKYHYLDTALPADASRPGTINSGDLMLYGSDCLVLFYESFSSSYSYTGIGSADSPEELKEALGSGSVTVTFSVP